MCRKQFYGPLLLAVALLIYLSGPCSARHDPDPWYRDMRGHWSRHYVRVLWEEEVTDGIVTRTYGRAYFQPDEPITRGQFTVLLSRVFQLGREFPTNPSFRDVDRDYEAYPRKPAWGFIEAAAAHDIVQGFPHRVFRPDDHLRRDHAVALLVRGLGLSGVAQAMSASDVEFYLERFRDDNAVDSSVRREMAAAIRYGIIEGYPDHTLRPAAALRRSEAAAVVYRSCTYRVSVKPMAIIREEPDAESIDLIPFILKNRAVRHYSLTVGDRHHSAHWNYARSSRISTPLPHHPWEGTSSAGRELQPGMYLVEGSAVDRKGNQFDAVPTAVYIFDPAISGTAAPASPDKGQQVTVEAWTQGGADAVTASCSGLPSTELSTSNPGRTNPQPRLNQHWTGRFEVPSEAAEGTHELKLRARFNIFGQQVFRESTVTLQVKPLLQLHARIVPNPAHSLAVVTLEARTSPTADSVEAQFLEHRLSLQTSDGGSTWSTARQLEGVDPGSYPVVFTAWRQNERKRTTVTLVVRGLERSDVIYHLAD